MMVGAGERSLHGLSHSSVFFGAVKCTVNGRKVTIKGKRGEVTKDLSHVACELKKMKQSIKKRTGTYIRIRIWFGGRKQACAVNTLKSAIKNMITGVTEVSLSPSAQPSRPCWTQPQCCNEWALFSRLILIINYTIWLVAHTPSPFCRASATR
jgi:hypothetical protein